MIVLDGKSIKAIEEILNKRSVAEVKVENGDKSIVVVDIDRKMRSKSPVIVKYPSISR